MSSFTPQYINYQDVEDYTRGKVVIKAIPTNETEYSQTFINDLCAKGESVVEMDFNRRYAIPFQTQDAQPFDQLPTSTQAYLSNLCTIQAVKLLLMIDFGALSAVLGDNYLEQDLIYYNTEKAKILAKDKVGLYLYYPLADLALNPLSYTGQTTAPAIRIVNPLGIGNNSTTATRRITSNTHLPLRTYPGPGVIINTDKESNNG